MKKSLNDWGISIFALIFAYFSYNFTCGTPVWIGNTLLGLFFYGIGNIKSRYWMNAGGGNNLLLILLIIIGTFLLFQPNLDFRINTVVSGCYFLYVVYALLSIYVLIGLVRYIDKSSYIDWLKYLGRNSMSFYLTHWMVICILYAFLNKVNLASNIELSMIAIVLTLCVILPFANMLLNTKWLKWTIGI